ncbi:pilus assembly protein TadG-related protein [Sphingomonas sp. TX0543]|uniref:pilus assembly protein TadG-related protein n=1 Tax=unclassified Sphingomonas TaxID=196159 RepID=UPI0010F5AC35|nr:pilus assembly protein TadG-related protein [Sphingomonas sp. 3P27F8]
MNRLAADRRGGAGMLVAAAMPVLIGLAAFAVDVGAIQLDARRLQGMADAAALAAASGDPGNGQNVAEMSVAAARFPRPVITRVTGGNYRPDPALAPGARFTPSSASGGADAVRVELESTSPTFLAAIFGRQSVTIGRGATAARQRYAGFSIGSRLASLDGGLLNAYLSALTGSNVSLSVMDYRALAGADVDLLRYLPLLRTTAGLQAATFGDVLKSNVSTPQALDALASALSADGQPQASNAIRRLLNINGSRSISLAALIDAGPLASQSEGGTGVVKADALALATALLQLGSPQRQVSLDLGASVPGLASTRVSLAIGEREAQSPWISITDKGTPIIRTAQARLYVRSRVAPAALAGLPGLISIDLPVFVELAGAQARLNAINCASEASRSVTLEAKTDLVRATIGTVDETRMGDFSTALTPSPARLVDTLLVDVIGSSTISLGAAEPWQKATFDWAAIQAGTRKTIRATAPVDGLATSLASQASLKVELIGLPIPIDPLLRSVGGLLQLVSPALDTLLMTTTGMLGVGIGEADLRATGMRCGVAVLVG